MHDNNKSQINTKKYQLCLHCHIPINTKPNDLNHPLQETEKSKPSGDTVVKQSYYFLRHL